MLSRVEHHLNPFTCLQGVNVTTTQTTIETSSAELGNTASVSDCSYFSKHN